MTDAKNDNGIDLIDDSTRMNGSQHKCEPLQKWIKKKVTNFIHLLTSTKFINITTQIMILFHFFSESFEVWWSNTEDITIFVLFCFVKKKINFKANAETFFLCHLDFFSLVLLVWVELSKHSNQ